MGILDYKQFTERHRPHIHPPDSVLFVTYRLAGSIPKATVRQYRAKKEWLAGQLAQVSNEAQERNTPALKKLLEQVENFNRDWFIKFEDILHKTNNGPLWMKDPRIADAVAASLQKLDGDAYRLDAYSVMSNHVHVVFKPYLSEKDLQESLDHNGRPIFTSEHPGLSRIMQSLKGSSARECNRILSRTGQFWEHESFDHVIREGEFFRTIKYVLNNPVKVGLVEDWREWRWNYCRSELSDKLLVCR
jgi:REP element-mobilizing transposase RayT